MMNDFDEVSKENAKYKKDLSAKKKLLISTQQDLKQQAHQIEELQIDKKRLMLELESAKSPTTRAINLNNLGDNLTETGALGAQTTMYPDTEQVDQLMRQIYELNQNNNELKRICDEKEQQLSDLILAKQESEEDAEQQIQIIKDEMDSKLQAAKEEIEVLNQQKSELEEENQRKQEIIEQEENQINQKNNSNTNINTKIIVKNQSINKEFQEKIMKFKKIFDNVLNNINNNEYKKSHYEFIQAQRLYKQPPKVFKKNQVPHFFIYKLFEINQKINQLSTSNKELYDFKKDIKKFNQLFEKELSKCKKNPEYYDDENVFDVNDKNSQNTSSNNDNDWFISSDDDETNPNPKIQNITFKLNNNTVKEKCTYQPKPKHPNNNSLNDEKIKKELEKYKSSRQKGKIIANIDHLFKLYQEATIKELVHEIQLEICFSFENEVFKHGFSLEKFTLILDILPNLMNDTMFLIHFMEKIEKIFSDYITQRCNYCTKNITLISEILPKYINIMETFKQKLQNDKKYDLSIEIEIMILENIYYNYTIDITPRSFNILDILNKKLFNESITENYKLKISLLNAFNLAVRQNSQQAANIIESIPLNTIFFQNPKNQILLNQTMAQIAFSAFNEGKYKLSYKYSDKLIDLDSLDIKIGTKSLIYSQLPFINEDIIINIYMFSTVFLHLPYMIVGFNDQFNIIEKYKIQQFINHKKSASNGRFKLHKNAKYNEKYKIIENMIQYAKEYDWQKAISFSTDELNKIYLQYENFCSNLKMVFLCCFLLTNKNTTLKTNQLVKMFSLPKKIIVGIISNMINGISPIEKIQIEFNGELTNDNKFVLIHDQNTESSYAGYSSLIENKTQFLQKGLDNFNSIKD